MKTLTVKLTQEPSAGLFRVVSFTNTVQLSVGQVVKAATVEDWCLRPHVQVHVVGMTPQVDEEVLLLDEPRTDALALVGTKQLGGGL